MDRLASGGPWFRRHPPLAAAVTVVFFLAVTALLLFVGDERDATALLYALPVALAGMTFGRRGGALAAAASTVLLWTWVAADDAVSLTALGWASRLVPLALLGVLVGAASDAIEETIRTRLELAVAEARRRDAAEVNDEIIQRLTVVKWRLEAGAGEDAADLLGDVMSEAQQLVASLLDGDDLEDRLQVKRTAPA